MRAAVLFLIAAIGCAHDHTTAPARPVAHSATPDAGAVAEIAEPDAPPPEPVKEEPPAAPAVPDEDIDSKDILARDPVSTPVLVKHVLIGWKALEPEYHGAIDPRAATRDRDDDVHGLPPQLA